MKRQVTRHNSAESGEPLHRRVTMLVKRLIGSLSSLTQHFQNTGKCLTHILKKGLIFLWETVRKALTITLAITAIFAVPLLLVNAILLLASTNPLLNPYIDNSLQYIINVISSTISTLLAEYAIRKSKLFNP